MNTVGDHPRSRGVYRRPGSRRRRASGSSPLARGLLRDLHGEQRRVRIIPARAGYTPRGLPALRQRQDHPRLRGVYGVDLGRLRRRRGSSPLARGLLVGRSPPPGAPRIIPARAGFTQSALASAVSHPGSSPLARGLRGADRDVRRCHRIIPARAGFTGAPTPRSRRAADHPRSRGVYVRYWWTSAPAAGSSPLARGLPRPGGGRGVGVGIIPARAGFTLLRRGWPQSD